MGWDAGTGFSRIYNWGADAEAGIDILASRMDADTNDIAAGINACINKNGLNTPTADLGMANWRHTDVGLATGHVQYQTTVQTQSNQLCWGGLATGPANEYVLTNVGGAQGQSVFPAFPSTYPTGGMVHFKVNVLNTGSSSLSVNGGTPREIVALGQSLTGGELVSSAVVTVLYDGNAWHLLSLPGEGATIGFYPAACRMALSENQDLTLDGSINEVVWPSNGAQWDDGAFINPADPFFPSGGTSDSATLTIPASFCSNNGSGLFARWSVKCGGLFAPEPLDNYNLSAKLWIQVTPPGGGAAGNLFVGGGIMTTDASQSLVPIAVNGQTVLEIEAESILKLVATVDIIDPTDSITDIALRGSADLGVAAWCEIRKVG